MIIHGVRDKTIIFLRQRSEFIYYRLIRDNDSRGIRGKKQTFVFRFVGLAQTANWEMDLHCQRI